MIIDLAIEYGLHPKRVASTNGGEYHSSCPRCGGKDRFIIWNQRNRYYCRQCEAKGGSIQFCRDFLGMSFKEACNKIGTDTCNSLPARKLFHQRFEPTRAVIPPQKWQKKALTFVHTCNERLLGCSEKMHELKRERGLSEKSIERFFIGWNANGFCEEADAYGLEIPIPSSNKVYFERGIVIPYFHENILAKVKIRCADWHQIDALSKYSEIKGSMKAPSLFDYAPEKPFLLVEAELDAMLASQCAGDFCCTLALGGASKKPDSTTHKLLLKAPLILFSLDFDDAGKRAFRFWKETYSNLYAWPVPKEKGPCDAQKAGVDLKHWILTGIEHFKPKN